MKVLVIENSSAICARLLALLRQSGRYEGLGCADCTEGALELVELCEPDLLLLALHPLDRTGFVLLKKLRSRMDALPVVVLSDSDAWQYRIRAQDLGASALLNKATQFDEILPTLDRLLGYEQAAQHLLEMQS